MHQRRAYLVPERCQLLWAKQRNELNTELSDQRDHASAAKQISDTLPARPVASATNSKFSALVAQDQLRQNVWIDRLHGRSMAAMRLSRWVDEELALLTLNIDNATSERKRFHTHFSV